MAKTLSISQNNNKEKLTPEELKEFRETYEQYQTAVYNLGMLDVEINAFKKRIDELNGNKLDLLIEIENLDKKQQMIGNKLGDKYGGKKVDLETGELI
jgi:hypothetical protein